jgi:hypothetical protein
MILDAQTFELILTPEAAMGIVGKTITSRGWQKYEVAEIRLVYTPYWIFSFDVFAEGASPVSGKAALNAYTGELSELVPVLLERPLSKTKSTSEMKAEVEPAAVSQNEVRDAAAAKIAGQAGVKREAIAISAVSKIYVPFFRIWVNVANESYKCDVDACLGSVTGLEALPKREKTWQEKNFFENITGMFKGAAGGAKGGGGGGSGVEGGGKGPVGWLIGTRTGMMTLLAIAIVVLLYFTLLAPRLGVACTGAITLVKDTYWMNGSCEFNNPTRGDLVAIVKAYANEDGKETQYSSVLTPTLAAGARKTEQFSVPWTAPGSHNYAFAWKIIS